MTYKNFSYQKKIQLTILPNLKKLTPLIIFALTTWIAHFWYYQNFGLYEDDYYRVAKAMTESGGEILSAIQNWFLNPNEGRPLHDSLIVLFSYIGVKLGGLQAIYKLGFLIITINAYLFYILLKLLWNNQPIFPAIGALAFCLFPADVTQPFLTHSLGIYPSLTFLLTALYCYINDRKKVSYLIILGSLLCYETIYPIFLVAPLLKSKVNRQLIRELFKHICYLGIMFVGVVIIRKLMGEERVADLEITFAMRTAIKHILIGSVMSMTMFVERSLQTLQTLKGENFIILPLYFLGTIWFLAQQKLRFYNNNICLVNRQKGKDLKPKLSIFMKPILRLSIVGLIMLTLAYPLTLSTEYSVYYTSGKASRIHAAAIVGASILFSCLSSAVILIAKKYQVKNIAIVGLSGLLTLLLGFGMVVQQDYVASWQYQKAFWTDVVRLCPDIKKSTIILVEGVPINSSKLAVGPFFRNPEIVLDKIYQFPEEGKRMIYFLNDNWQDNVTVYGDKLQVNHDSLQVPKDDYLRTIKTTNTILLEENNGKLQRRTEPLTINHQELHFQQAKTSATLPLPRGVLYKYLIKKQNTEPLNYLNY